MGATPKIAGILETCLYVDDMEAADAFYRGTLGLEPIFEEPQMRTFSLGPASVLILFERGTRLEPAQTPGGTIPPHDGSGPMHVAFAIPADALDGWQRHLSRNNCPIVGEVTWKQGGTSLYLHDPAGNLIEMATPGLWSNYPRDLR